MTGGAGASEPAENAAAAAARATGAAPDETWAAGGAPDAFDILVDGDPVEAYSGETIATALLAAGRRTLRRSPRRHEPRGLYCVMGVCWECVVLVDGRSVRACVEPAAPGLRVATVPRGPGR